MFSIFSHKDQMHMHLENTVSTMSNFVVISHRLSVIQPIKRLQAYKYQIKTNGTQERQLRQFAGSCRFVWNKTLAMQKERLDSKESCLSYNKIALLLPQWKVEHSFLKESHSQVLQQALMNLDRAIKDAFNKTNPKRFPIFKKRGKHDSFRFPQGFKLDQDNSRIYLPKIGWLQYRNSRIIDGTPRNVTVSQSGGHWYISMQTEREVVQPVHPSSSIIGIDVGITKLATLSDGIIFEPVNSFHTRIANVRKDYLHKTTTIISQNHAIVCIEDLKIKNMSKSANGTIEKPGRNVKAKSGLNRSILDQGWFEFRRQLEYKEVWLGGEVIAVPARNTSRKCPVCDHISADNRKTQAAFACVNCGYENNADIVGAINVLAAGHAVLLVER